MNQTAGRVRVSGAVGPALHNGTCFTGKAPEIALHKLSGDKERRKGMPVETVVLARTQAPHFDLDLGLRIYFGHYTPFSGVKYYVILDERNIAEGRNIIGPVGWHSTSARRPRPLGVEPGIGVAA